MPPDQPLEPFSSANKLLRCDQPKPLPLDILLLVHRHLLDDEEDPFERLKHSERFSEVAAEFKLVVDLSKDAMELIVPNAAAAVHYRLATGEEAMAKVMTMHPVGIARREQLVEVGRGQDGCKSAGLDVGRGDAGGRRPVARLVRTLLPRSISLTLSQRQPQVDLHQCRPLALAAWSERVRC